MPSLITWLKLFRHALRRDTTPAMLQQGDPAPPFRVRDEAGNEVALRDFAGRPLVLWFYPKADTPG